MTRFLPHGEVRVHREGRILILEGHGPWNVEALQHSTDKAQPILQELSGAPWGVMASISAVFINKLEITLKCLTTQMKLNVG